MIGLKKLLEILRGEPQNLNKLIKRGLVVGTDFCRMGEAIIDPTHCYHITIGNHVTFAPRVHILAHDASTFHFIGKTRVGNVHIGDYTFIGASAIVMPGVSIGKRCIIGAGSVVTRSIPDGSVAAGNPARVICTTDEYLAKIQSRMNDTNTFDSLWYEGYPEKCKKAVRVAEEQGEIYVS